MGFPCRIKGCNFKAIGSFQRFRHEITHIELSEDCNIRCGCGMTFPTIKKYYSHQQNTHCKDLDNRIKIPKELQDPEFKNALSEILSKASIETKVNLLPATNPEIDNLVQSIKRVSLVPGQSTHMGEGE